MTFNWLSLQNGSDIRGVALDGLADESVTLDEQRAVRIARAFAAWLKKKKNAEGTLRVALGRDSRLSGPALSRALSDGLTMEAVSVLEVGLATTPAMFMTTVDPELACDGAIMVTASHLPWNRNGMKFFTAAGGLEKTDITDILERAASLDDSRETTGSSQTLDYLPHYAAGLVRRIREGADAGPTPLAGLRIVVDAGNGAAGFFAEEVLQPLGADTSGSQFLDPDGRFPNHVPNPENDEAMAAICDAVRLSEADLGIIFDTDGDRSSVVDADANPIHRNRLIALLSAICLREFPGTTIVTDSITSDELALYIEGLGGRHHRFKRGYRNVINEAMRLNAVGIDSQLAIETSGHGALKENYFLDDGAYLVAKILIEYVRLKKEGRSLADLLAALDEPVEAAEVRFQLQEADFRRQGQAVLTHFEAAFAAHLGTTIVPDNYEGVRVQFDAEHGDGWCLLRLSLHDPVLPLNLESRQTGGVARMAREIQKILAPLAGLDLTALTAVL